MLHTYLPAMEWCWSLSLLWFSIAAGFQDSRALLKRLFSKFQNIGNIGEHLSTLRELASMCHHVTELGVETGTSTWALMLGLDESPHHPKTHVAYDLNDFPDQRDATIIAEDLHIEYAFHRADSLQLVSDSTDLLFIDTHHSYMQLLSELHLHGPKTRRWVVMHDTEVDGQYSQCVRKEFRNCDADARAFGVPVEVARRGMQAALREFLQSRQGSHWRVVRHYENNNGLTVLERVGSSYPSLRYWPPECSLTNLHFADRSVDFDQWWSVNQTALNASLHSARLSLQLVRHRVDSHMRLGVLLYTFGRPAPTHRARNATELALRHLATAVRLATNCVASHCIDARLAYAINLCPLWQWCECSPALVMLAQKSLTDVVTTSDRWEVHAVYAGILSAQGLAAEALVILQHVLEIAPWSRHAVNIAGEMFRRLGHEAQAQAAFEAAVTAGLWHDSRQRPATIWYPSIGTGNAFLPSPTGLMMEVLTTLQNHWQILRDEFHLWKRSAEPSTIYKCIPGKSCAGSMRSAEYRDEVGHWEEYYYMSKETMFAGSKRLCQGPPQTCSQLAKLPLPVTRAAVSVVHPPETRIPVHRSMSQGRWRLHCPLVVPSSSESVLWIGKQRQIFVEGQCWWFDESFEHSLIYRHENEPRVSFYIDVVDPALTAETAAEVETPPFSGPYWQSRLCS